MSVTDSTAPPAEMLDSIIRTLRVLVIATVVLYLLQFGGYIYIYVQSAEANKALCTFRANLAEEAAASNNFLLEHPEGVPGITPETIREGAHRQETAVTSLSGLSC
jgi:hypothetical protein